MKLPDMARLAQIIETIAVEEMLPKFRSLAAGEVREKSPGNYVTIVDEVCERRLCAALTELLPGSTVVGEEGAAREPAIVERIDGDAPVWIIDPLDGTYNFTHGIDTFVSMVALAHHGRTLAGVIHDPVNGVTATAVAGEGAFIGARRLQVAAPAPLDQMTGVVSWARKPEWRRRLMKRLADRLASKTGFSCVGYEYLRIAGGDIQVALFNKLNPWDHAAGMLVVEAAGGRVTDVHGNPLDFSHGHLLSENYGIVATNGRFHDAVLQALDAVGV